MDGIATSRVATDPAPSTRRAARGPQGDGSLRSPRLRARDAQPDIQRESERNAKSSIHFTCMRACEGLPACLAEARCGPRRRDREHAPARGRGGGGHVGHCLRRPGQADQRRRRRRRADRGPAALRRLCQGGLGGRSGGSVCHHTPYAELRGTSNSEGRGPERGTAQRDARAASPTPATGWITELRCNARYRCSTRRRGTGPRRARPTSSWRPRARWPR